MRWSKLAIPWSLLVFCSPLLFVPIAAMADVRLVRFISELPEHAGQACLGVVTQATYGKPEQIANLGAADPAFCQPVEQAVMPQQIRQAFSTAERLSGIADLLPAETIQQQQLATRILPPVSVSLQQLKEGTRRIIGVGFNYLDHIKETGDYSGDAPLLLFAKPVSPTGAYVPIKGEVSPSLLLDYEVELAVILLEPVDLAAPPPPQKFYADVAIALANDVSNRVPVILDPDFGYTQGKSEVGFLPLGPWLRRGREELVNDAGEWIIRATLGLQVDHDDGTRTLEQYASLLQMRFDPFEIVRTMASVYQAGRTVCMRDRFGRPHRVLPEDGILPAGSILLTGTAAGTAIQAPGLFKKLRLFIRGGFSIKGAKRAFLQEQLDNADVHGYLRPGERVRTKIGGLGQQSWLIQQGSYDLPLEWPDARCVAKDDD